MKIAVIGTGTVGVLSVCHFLGHTKDVQVVCIHNPKKSILGIGESSTVRMTELLWNTLNFNVGVDGEDLQCTIKTGVKFKNWRKHEFTSPMFFPGYGMHFDNFKLAEVIFSKAQEKYRDRFSELKIDIESLEQNDDEVIINKTYKFDYVIDCRGFPKDYSNYTMVNLPINHCLVHAVDKPGDWNFTYHTAHENGWMFGIPLRKRQGWGYLYNDQITSKKEAIDNFNTITKQNINYENVREYQFKPFKANKYVNGRIMLNGNSALFYEPIEAISGGFYDTLNVLYYEYIFNKTFNERDINLNIHYMADKYVNFISYLYHGGSVYDTNFWRHAAKICNDNLKNEKWLETIESIKQGKENITRFPLSCEAWRILDKNLYNGKTFNNDD